ncbi:hypothetical protein KR093_006575 [Drosophila rubida]|uniref:Disease resistance R13L4/SHOC-2-like LRR domain-containing protein n=1 Tax=Drosophila rubida TaxID=30044 RepID=A0AAD4KCH7_9MUSC|nr:hypothetical protein KR093_006575 [Drosophila rubida]
MSNNQQQLPSNADGFAPIVTASRIPRGAARPRQSTIATARPSFSPRMNHSFLPVFHERASAEDAALLTPTLWKQARKSGALSLQNKGMARVPERLYDINDADEDSKTANLEELSLNEDDAWWNQQPLNHLDLSSNALTHISPKIENLSTLTVLLLHDNALVALPPQIGKLEKLVRLNLSHNKLNELPPDLFSLPELRHLNISHNEFIELNPDISNLHMLEFLDASNNNIKSLPGGIGFLVRLTALLLPNNHIKELPPDIVNLRSLQKLDLMKNDLVDLPEDMGLLRKLQCLYIQHNDIKELPSFEGNETLNELHASNNYIERVPKDLCSNLPHLKIFDLRDNKIAQLPDEICLMRNLNRLDISNNSISVLPVTLSSLAHLISLQVEGNPIKTIRRDIIQCGTARILKTLQERAQTKDREVGGTDANSVAVAESQMQDQLPAGNVDNYRQRQQVAPVQANYNLEYERQFQSQQFMQQQQLQQQQLQQLEPQQSTRLPAYYAQFTHPAPQFNPQAQQLNSLASQFNGPTAQFRPQPSQFDLQASQFNSPGAQFNSQTSLINGFMSPPGYGQCMPQVQQLNYRQAVAHAQLLAPHILPQPHQESADFMRTDVQPRWVYKLRHTRTLAVNLEGLTHVPDHVFEIAASENVHVIDFARNQLKQLPNGLQHMSKLVTELVLSHNTISVVQPFISQFTRIAYLNLSNNLLTDLPHEFGVLNTLRELNIGNNRLTFIPKALYELQGLEILLASDNHIKALNVAGLENMGRLNTLDLRNNDIESIPPILGNLTNITHLELVGNPFRQPRHQILMKGTDAIMSYLRDRIPI